MLLKKNKSIMIRIIFFFLSLVVIVSLLGGFYFIYINTKTIIKNEIESKLQAQLSNTVNQIERRISENTKFTQGISKSVESVGTELNEKQFQNLLVKNVTTNKDVIGMGFWFEPNKYKKNLQYFSPYAYKDKGQVKYTIQYNTPKYDYTKQEWYRNAVNSVHGVSWDNPSYDVVLKKSTSTIAVPFYDEKKKLLGVTTREIDISSLQEMILGIKVGTTGKAFLLDNNGTYIASHNISDVSKKEKIGNNKNKSLASISKLLISNKKGTEIYLDEGVNKKLYYAKIPSTGWILVITINESELLDPLNNLYIRVWPLMPGLIFLVLLVFIILSRIVIKNNKKMNEISLLLNGVDNNCNSDSCLDGINEKDTIVALKEFFDKANNGANLIADSASQLTVHVGTIMELNGKTYELINSIKDKSKKMSGDSKNSEKMAKDISNQINELTLKINSLEKHLVSESKKYINNKSAIDSAINKMETTNEKVELLENVINELNDKSHEIAGKIGCINDIAVKINLLSLNSAIEALKAGEKGKDFAVVADEIRQLSEEASKVAGEINNITELIQNDTSKAVVSMNDCACGVNEGIDIISLSNNVFEYAFKMVDMLKNEINIVVGLVSELDDKRKIIYNSTVDVSSTSKDIEYEIEDLKVVEEQQKEGIDLVSKINRDFTKQTDEMRSLVSKFNV